MIAPSAFPLLSSIIFLPLLGAMAIAFVKEINLAKKIAIVTASLELILTLLILFSFNNQNGDFQLVEKQQWIPSLHAEYLLGVDGISVLFLPMTALLTLITIVASWNNVQNLTRLHFALLLLLESVTLGVFTALDMLLFFLFWEATLPPIFFLISLWGIGAQRRAAALKYTLYMLCGGVPLLFAIILLAINHAEHSGLGLAFSFPLLLKTAIPHDLQTLIFSAVSFRFCGKSSARTFSYLVANGSNGSPYTTDCVIDWLETRRVWLAAFCVSVSSKCRTSIRLDSGVIRGNHVGLCRLNRLAANQFTPAFSVFEH
jgi:NADH-quinone oxidoreductase subunit M